MFDLFPQLLSFLLAGALLTVIVTAGGFVASIVLGIFSGQCAAPEMMMHATEITSEYYMPMPVYLMTGGIYFALAFPFSLLVRYFERRNGTRVQRTVA